MKQRYRTEHCQVFDSRGEIVAEAFDIQTAQVIVDAMNAMRPTIGHISEFTGRHGELTVGEVTLPVYVTQVTVKNGAPNPATITVIDSGTPFWAEES